MSWNIEIAVFHPMLENFSQIIPDVFEESETEVYFEDATSVRIGKALCIGNFNNSTILIDVNCRLNGKLERLKELSENRQIYFCRISNSEICLTFENGKEVSDSILEKIKNQNNSLDGEQRAWAYLGNKMSLRCPTDLLESQYKVFKIK